MPLPGTNKFFSIECSPQNEPVYTVPTQRGASKAYADDKYTSALPPVTVVVPKDTPYDVDGDWGFNYDENDRPYPITPAVPTAADDEDGPESEEVMPTPPGEADDDGADAGAATTATGTEGARRLRSTSSWSAPPPPSSPSFSVESEDAVVSLCKDSSCKSECKQMIVTKSNTCTPIKPRNWLYGVPTHTAFAPKVRRARAPRAARDDLLSPLLPPPHAPPSSHPPGSSVHPTRSASSTPTATARAPSPSAASTSPSTRSTTRGRAATSTRSAGRSSRPPPATSPGPPLGAATTSAAPPTAPTTRR
jgi:hypothetical protein